MKPITPINPGLKHICYISNTIKYLTSNATSIIRLNIETMEADQLYFSDFEIVQMQIKEIKSYTDAEDEDDSEGVIHDISEFFNKNTQSRRKKNSNKMINLSKNIKKDSISLSENKSSFNPFDGFENSEENLEQFEDFPKKEKTD